MEIEAEDEEDVVVAVSGAYLGIYIHHVSTHTRHHAQALCHRDMGM